MATAGGANIAVDGLVFGYDTGYPLVSGNSDAYKFNRGEPTTTFDVGDMTPSSPNTFFTSSASYDYNLHGTVWDWTFYPNSNPSAEGGMEWHPDIKGPGFKGAWLMKKRPGGNSESNFSGNTPGTIESTSAYTVSVWCKTDQASCFRIHINTTKNGSSYWGYASSQHSGGGDWERLSVTIPANEGNTSLNVIRCQALGTTITANAYFRNYQVEKNTHPTPFLLGGTRSVSGSLIDLTRTTDIDLSNVSFDSNAQMTFDGTDDYITKFTDSRFQFADTDLTYEVVVYFESNPNSYQTLIGLADTADYIPRINLSKSRSGLNNGSVYMQLIDQNGSGVASFDPDLSGADLIAGEYYHYVGVIEKPSGVSTYLVRLYRNGELVTTTDSGRTTYDTSQNIGGTIGLAIGTQFGNSTNVLDGQLPIAKIYNRALTATEVLQNYNAVKERFSL